MVIVDARGSQRSRPRNVAPRLVLEVQGVGYVGVHGHQRDAERTLRRNRTRRCLLTGEARASPCRCAGAWRQGFHGDSVAVSIAVPGQGRDDRLRDVTVIEPCDIRAAAKPIPRLPPITTTYPASSWIGRSFYNRVHRYGRANIGQGDLHAPCPCLQESWDSRPKGIHIYCAQIPVVKHHELGAAPPAGPLVAAPARVGAEPQGSRGGIAPYCLKSHIARKSRAVAWPNS
jgi:hypothetical protein